jgi:hypothetical protein
MMRSFKSLAVVKQRDNGIKTFLAAVMPEKKVNENVSLEKHET